MNQAVGALHRSDGMPKRFKRRLLGIVFSRSTFSVGIPFGGPPLSDRLELLMEKGFLVSEKRVHRTIGLSSVRAVSPFLHFLDVGGQIVELAERLLQIAHERQ